MTDSNTKPDKGFLRDLDTRITDCVNELKLDDSQMKSFRFMKPKQTVAELSFVMDGGKNEMDIPIMEERNKELFGIISLVDLVRFLPPGDKLPKQYFVDENKQTELQKLQNAVTNFIKENGYRTIEDAFAEQLEVFYERFHAEKSAVRILDKDFLKDVFQKLIDATDGKIKYRTLPIVKHDPKNKNEFVVRRMWSYIDALKLIIDMKEKGTASLLTEEIGDKVCTKKVYTLKQNDTLSQALLNLQQLSFYPTHLPITEAGDFTAGKTVVKGIVDEVLINTLEHDIFRQDLAAMPISYIATPIKRQETVKLDTKISDLIQILINRRTKPTAILVGEYNPTTNEFEMDGIVNYVDLFNRILEWAKES